MMSDRTLKLIHAELDGTISRTRSCRESAGSARRMFSTLCFASPIERRTGIGSSRRPISKRTSCGNCRLISIPLLPELLSCRPWFGW